MKFHQARRNQYMYLEFLLGYVLGLWFDGFFLSLSFSFVIFRHTQPRILFSYKSQVDEIPEDDTVSMPYQTNVPKSEDTDNMSVSFDSTHFDHHSGSYYTRPSSLLPNSSVNVAEEDIGPDGNYYQASA